MKRIEVLRIGQRLVRDDRVTTHVALVARAFGASKIFMNEVNPEIKDTVEKVNRSWGSGFELEFIDDWKKILRSKKKSAKIVHLTMYGENVNDVQEKLRNEDEILVVVGAEKVPREVYDYADYNVAVGNQPHSEVSALAIILDRIQNGKQFDIKYNNARLEIIPSKKGKKVIAKSD
ncbi:MAG: tRNA (cytidine(56)-2'-O)-methyltransferase [Candidatus Nitrosotenuis sp.]